jgi:SHS2 domain-containing protein
LKKQGILEINVKKFQYLRHTADAKFKAFGRSLEEAFCHAALATASLMWDCDLIEPYIKHSVFVSAKDEEQLLLNFLEEILFLLDSQMFLTKKADGLRIEKRNGCLILDAQLIGDTCSNRYQTFGEVKAITYNEMKIVKGSLVEVQVVVDM